MIELFLAAAASAASPASTPARPKLPAPAAPAASAGPARSVIEAQLQSPPREANRRALSAEEADAIYKRYLASIGQRPERAPDTQSGGTP